MLVHLTDNDWKDFIKADKKVVMVSLVLPNGKDCPYCVKLGEKLETLNFNVGEIIINDSTEFKKEYFKTLESGKAFPVMIVFENGIEKYRATGDMQKEDIISFIETGKVPQHSQNIKNNPKPMNNMSTLEIKALLYDQILLLRRVKKQIEILESELEFRDRK